MDTEDNPIGRRQTLVPILATIGAGLVVAAVISLLGVKWPWLLLILGVVLILIAVFLSKPSTINLPIHIFRRIRGTHEWKRYGPKHSVPPPIISQAIIPGGSQYTTTLFLVISNRDNSSLEVNLDPIILNIEQKREKWETPLRCHLTLPASGYSYQHKILPNKAEPYTIPLFGTCYGEYPEVKVNYNYGAQNIKVKFRGVWHELHEGIYIKPANRDFKRVSLV